MKHLSVIIDGNGRWAENRGLPRKDGHAEGARALCKAIEDFATIDADILSVYAFSTENEKRDKEEVANLFGIMAYFFRNEIYRLAEKYSLKLRFIGDFRRLPDILSDVMSDIGAKTINNKGKTVVFAVGYGGDEEICSAFDRILKNRMFLMDVSPIRKEELYENLYTVGLPFPDAVLRYGGYRRLSNFLPVQTAYSELFFIDKLWPDYDKEDFEKVIDEFSHIKRNFGGNNG